MLERLQPDWKDRSSGYGFYHAPWDEAFYSFIQHLKGNSRAPKTVELYDYLLRSLVHWAEDKNLSLDKFGKRSLAEYLVWRQQNGHRLSGEKLSLTTLHSSTRVVRVFLKYCSRYDLIPRYPLADYELRKAPYPYKYMPKDVVMPGLSMRYTISGTQKNKPVSVFPVSRRNFHCERNYAIVMTLLDSACRIGEVLSLKTSDLQQVNVQVKGRQNQIWQLSILESGSNITTKGGSTRFVPLSEDTVNAIHSWLKIRNRIMKQVSSDEDPGYLFLSETGGRCDESRFLKSIENISDFFVSNSQFAVESCYTLVIVSSLVC